MFNDRRSKRVVIVAHCLLNQNSISDGTADFLSQFTKIIDLIISNQVGLIQLPCPEVACLGLDRSNKQGGKRSLLMENTRIRDLMSKMSSVAMLQDKAEETATLIQEYQSYGFRVLGVIGVDRSPSCGVETTTKDNDEVKGQGIFIELISEACHRRGQTIKVIGVKTSKIDESAKRVQQLLEMVE